MATARDWTGGPVQSSDESVSCHAVVMKSAGGEHFLGNKKAEPVDRPSRLRCSSCAYMA